MSNISIYGDLLETSSLYTSFQFASFPFKNNMFPHFWMHIAQYLVTSLFSNNVSQFLKVYRVWVLGAKYTYIFPFISLSIEY